MKTPQVNAVGITEYPTDLSTPRPLSRRWRVMAAAMLLVFAVAVVSTTVLSVGRYCLTSDGGDTRSLPGR